MIIEALPVGQLQANCFLVGCEETGEGFVIDPGGDADEILMAIEAMELTVRYIFDTHGHADHVAANAVVREGTGATLYIHAADREMIESPDAMAVMIAGGLAGCAPDATYGEGDEIKVGGLTVRVMHTPGHTLGGVCLCVGDDVFTGDTLFAGSVGRTDFPGGSWETLSDSLRRLLDELDPATRIHPGHGPSSAMAEEALSNPFLADLR